MTHKTIIDEIQARAESGNADILHYSPLVLRRDRCTLLAILAEIDVLETHEFFNYKPSLSGRRFVDYDALKTIFDRTTS